MKKETINHIFKQLSALSLMILFLSGCSTDDSVEDPAAENEDTVDIEILAEIQSMTETLDDMAEVLSTELDPGTEFKSDLEKAFPDGPYFSSCVSRTLVTEGNNINISLDYGSGCEGPHGNVLAGVVRIDIQLLSLEEQLVTHSFDDFSINGRTIEGSVTRNRIRSNADGYPEVRTSRDLTIQWNENASYNRQGDTKRVWVEGRETRGWGDDVFLITGNWTIERNGVLLRSVSISDELRREMACRFLVSGTMDFEGTAASYTLDYGDGSCDDKAVVRIGEREVEIQLGRLKNRIRK